MLLFVFACVPLEEDSTDKGGDTDEAVDTDTAGDSGATCVEEPTPPDTKDTGGAPRVAREMVADVTWTLEFDETAEAGGYVDCSYRRVYDAQIEVADQGYLCPSCDLVTTGTAVMTEGYDDCFLQIDDADAERTELLGLAEVDGVPHFFRSDSENVTLRDMGEVDGATVSWSDEATIETGGAMVLAAIGTFAVAESDTVTLADPNGAQTTPYSCGWPMNNPGGPNAEWPLVAGEIVPNVRLEDQCGEAVDLWDFRGYYLVIDASSPNCGPCQAMASEAEAFRARMDEACVPVELITLLNASLSAVNEPADLETRLAWAEEYDLTSPVLADRGFAYALFPAFLVQEGGMSLPSTLVVDPEGRLLYGASGFGTWEEFETVILDDVAARGE